MPELLVPGTVRDPFREHYRELIVSSLLRSAREQSLLSREQNRHRRAARYERAVALLGGAPPAAPEVPVPSPPVEAEVPAPPPAVEPLPPPPAAVPAPAEADHDLASPVIPVLIPGELSFGPILRGAAAAVWLLTLATLAVNLLVFGFRSWATGAADLGLIALTLVLFLIAAEDLGRPGNARS